MSTKDTCPKKKQLRDIIGEKIGMSGRQYDRLKYLDKHAPEVIGRLDRKETTIGRAYKELRTKEKAEAAGLVYDENSETALAIAEEKYRRHSLLSKTKTQLMDEVIRLREENAQLLQRNETLQNSTRF